MKAMTKFALAAALALAPMAAAAQPSWAPLEMADPGAEGRRIGEDGLIGNWFPAAGENRPAILLLGGSEGALSNAGMRMAKALQAQGFSVLQLSYFRAPGQSPLLELVPLELFDRALGWIARQPGVDGTRLGIIGLSKGAEAALLVASRNPSVKAVVLGAPSSVAWPGVVWDGQWSVMPRPSWSLGGQPVPVLPYGAFSEKDGIRSLHDNGLAALEQHLDSVIPVERVRASILLVCGEHDSLWPSCPMARQVEARARAAGRPPVTLLAYPDAGHFTFGMPTDPSSPTFAQLAILGGTAEGNNAARSDSWPRAVAFLQQALR